MTTFEKFTAVLNFSIDGKTLYALNLSNGETVEFPLKDGIRIYNKSNSELVIESADFPSTGIPFLIEIHNRWPNISYDPNRDLLFACGIGVGMAVINRIENPALEDSYSMGIDAKSYFNDLTKHELYIINSSGNELQFRSL